MCRPRGGRSIVVGTKGLGDVIAACRLVTGAMRVPVSLARLVPTAPTPSPAVAASVRGGSSPAKPKENPSPSRPPVADEAVPTPSLLPAPLLVHTRAAAIPVPAGLGRLMPRNPRTSTVAAEDPGGGRLIVDGVAIAVPAGRLAFPAPAPPPLPPAVAVAAENPGGGRTLVDRPAIPIPVPVAIPVPLELERPAPNAPKTLTAPAGGNGMACAIFLGGGAGREGT